MDNSLLDRALALEPFANYTDLDRLEVIGDAMLGLFNVYKNQGVGPAARLVGSSKRNAEFRERYFGQEAVPKKKAHDILSKVISYAESVQNGRASVGATADPELREQHEKAHGETSPDAANKPRLPLPDGDRRPTFHLLDDWLEFVEQSFPPGVYYCTDGKDERVSAPLKVIDVSTDIETDATLITVEFHHSHRDVNKTLSLDLADIATEPKIVQRHLAYAGFIDVLNPGLLMAHLKSTRPDAISRSIGRTGWVGNDAFILGSETIGDSGIRYSGSDLGLNAQGGSLDGWRRDVCAPLEGNPVSVLAVSVSWAGALLEPLKADTFGIHLHGQSSIGKTSTLEAASSVWGAPERQLATWSASESGIEGLACSRNSMCLTLDEIGQADPARVGNMIYALGNGTGKARSDVYGLTANVNHWKMTFISSGELSVRQSMAPARRSTMSGQDVRLLNVKANRGRLGAWDNTHGLSGAEMSETIKTAARTNHGHAGHAFVEYLIEAKPDFEKRLRDMRRHFSTDGYSGVTDRAARQFAIAALAGELATEARLTGWPVGHATECAVTLFNEWLDTLPAPEPDGESIAQMLAAYVIENPDDLLDRRRSTDADFRESGVMVDAGAKGIEHIYLSTNMLAEVSGMTAQRAGQLLDDSGLLVGKTKHLQNQLRLKGKKTSAYKINWSGIEGLVAPDE